MTRIAILGGGLSGRLTALQLAEQGYQIALFDKGTRQGEHAAAYVAAAMLAPAAEAVEATPEVIKLGRQSIPLWRNIRGRLKTPAMMQENGSLIVWHGQDKPLSNEFVRHLKRGGVADDEIVRWRADDIAEREPQAQYDWLIDCRGYGAKTAWNQAPEHTSTLRGIRGEVARVYTPEITLNRPVRLLHPRYPLYIAPKENHVFVIGATQIESESQAPASVRSGLELLSALYAVHPAFGEADILEIATGLRPTLNHHNPEIRYNRARRLIEINGLFRHGFMISPAVTAAAVRLAVALFDGKDAPERDEESGLAYIGK